VFDYDMTDSSVITALHKELKLNDHLESLVFETCKLGNSGASVCADYLMGNNGLKQLFLEENDITNQGCVSLGNSLRRINTLKGLSLLEHVGVGERGIRVLLDGLRYWTMILHWKRLAARKHKK